MTELYADYFASAENSQSKAGKIITQKAQKPTSSLEITVTVVAPTAKPNKLRFKVDRLEDIPWDNARQQG